MDHVEWSYLKAVLCKMGFDENVVSLIMKRVTSARYQIIHAGREFGNIVPERGLRQGDPLSSYLFLICIEGFTYLIKECELRRLLRGIQVAREAPHISHMFFADDCYIYCKADKEEATHIIHLLNVFERVSGKKINMDKSSVFFSRNVNAMIKREVCEMLWFCEADNNSYYLGLPNIIGRNKTVMLGYFKDEIQDRVRSWDGKFLTMVGKEIFIKSVAQTIPNYAMNVFLLPLELCRDIKSIMCRFWWRKSTKDRGIY